MNWYVCSLNSHVGAGLKHVILGLTPLSSDTTALSRSYLFFKSLKVTVNGYYGIENPLPNVITKLHRFLKLLNATRWLSSVTGSHSGLLKEATIIWEKVR